MVRERAKKSIKEYKSPCIFLKAPSCWNDYCVSHRVCFANSIPMKNTTFFTSLILVLTFEVNIFILS